MGLSGVQNNVWRTFKGAGADQWLFSVPRPAPCASAGKVLALPLARAGGGPGTCVPRNRFLCAPGSVRRSFVTRFRAPLSSACGAGCRTLNSHGPAGLASADAEAVSGRGGEKHRPAGALPHVSARSPARGRPGLAWRGLRAPASPWSREGQGKRRSLFPKLQGVYAPWPARRSVELGELSKSNPGQALAPRARAESGARRSLRTPPPARYVGFSFLLSPKHPSFIEGIDLSPVPPSTSMTALLENWDRLIALPA